MNQIPQMLLIHPAGASRQAIAAFVSQRGVPVVKAISVAGGEKELISTLSAPFHDVIVIHHTQLAALSEPIQDRLRRFNAILITPDGAHEARGFARGLTEPVNFESFEKMLPELGMSSSGSPLESCPGAEGTSVILLRGLAHAMNNVATSSLSWLSLAERQDDPAKRGQHFKDLRADLGRLSRFARALTYLSGTNGPPVMSTVDVSTLLIGLGHVPTSRAFASVCGRAERDPLELGLSLAISGTQAKLDLRVDSNSDVTIVLTDPTLDPHHVESPVLDRLLETQRFSRALGLALLSFVVTRCGGAFRVVPLIPEGATLTVTIPRAVEAMEASQ